IGDVRGKGLDAVRLASIVLGSYRHVAYERADLRAIVADLDRAVARSVGDEDFVTAALVEERGGTLTIVNCGHPAPLLLRRGQVGLLSLRGAIGGGILVRPSCDRFRLAVPAHVVTRLIGLARLRNQALDRREHGDLPGPSPPQGRRVMATSQATSLPIRRYVA